MFNSKKIVLDQALYERIAKVAAQAGYASVQDFVVHAIERQLQHLEEAQDEEAIRKRLEGLGYIK